MRRRIYTLLGLIVCLLGAALTPAFAVHTVLAVSGSCNQVTVTYSASDFPGLTTIDWTFSEADETFIADGSFLTGTGASLTRVITVPVTLIAGDGYRMLFDIGGAGSDMKFTATACASVSESGGSSSSEPVIPPPCKLEDTRLDEGCGSTFVVTYAQPLEDGCYISVYSKYGRADGKVVLVLQAIPTEIASAQAVGGNAIIDSADVVNLGSVTVYWLPETGEFQINAGPNEEGKVYVLNFTGCPAANVYTTNSYQKTE